MSVEYGTITLYGVVLYDDEAKRIEGLDISDDDWDNYFHTVNAWGSIEDGLIFGLFQCFNTDVCVVEASDLFPTPKEIKKFEEEMKDKPWFQEIEWSPEKYIVNYCY